MFSSKHISRWAKIALVGLLFGVLAWYGAPPLMVWYVPTRIPAEVVREAQQELPDSFQVTATQQAASPLHWRVTYLGRFDDEPDLHYQMVYKRHRLTGSVDSSLGFAAGTHYLFALLLPFTLAMAFCLSIYMLAPRVLGRPCPHCDSKPFTLVKEQPLQDDDCSVFTTYRGHYKCSSCGLNQIAIYTGSRNKKAFFPGDIVGEMGFGSLLDDEAEEDISTSECWTRIDWMRRGDDSEWFEDS